MAIIIFIAFGALSLFLLQSKPKDIENRNAQREYDVALLVQILTAYYDEQGVLPKGVTTKFVPITNADDGIDLCSELIPAYLTDLPFDPTGGMVTEDGGCSGENQLYRTGYSLKKNAAGNEITVVATTSEGGKVISLTKRLY